MYIKSSVSSSRSCHETCEGTAISEIAAVLEQCAGSSLVDILPVFD